MKAESLCAMGKFHGKGKFLDHEGGARKLIIDTITFSLHESVIEDGTVFYIGLCRRLVSRQFLYAIERISSDYTFKSFTFRKLRFTLEKSGVCIICASQPFFLRTGLQGARAAGKM